MKRKTEFRAITSGYGKWVYGDLIHLDKDILIAGEDMAAGSFENGHIELQAISVWPNSIGQYIGIRDKTGKKIYEGDIMKRITGYKFEVKVTEFSLGNVLTKVWGHGLHPDDIVIGNIYDNPELK